MEKVQNRLETKLKLKENLIKVRNLKEGQLITSRFFENGQLVKKQYYIFEIDLCENKVLIHVQEFDGKMFLAPSLLSEEALAGLLRDAKDLINYLKNN